MTSEATPLNEAGAGLPVFDTAVFRSTMAGLMSGKPLIIQQGGTSSGKTYSIILALATYLSQNQNLTCSVVSCTFPHLKRGAIRDFAGITGAIGGLQKWNQTDCVGQINGNTIEFFSADNDGKVRGGKRDILFINEANLINYERYRQLSIRTGKTVIIDFNPVSEFWLHTDVIPAANADDMIFRRTTYRDNPRVPEKIIREIEALKTTNEQLYRVYGLGLTGNVTGLVFPNFVLVDEFPKDAKKQGVGLDFGFTNDPTAAVRIGFLHGELYLHELIYETGLTNPDISQRMKQVGIGVKEEVFADSAEPKSIEELRRLGWNIRGTVKREINFGIDLMRRYRINITKDSLNLAKELRNYSWKVDSNGKSLNIPIDAFNHAIDASRYACIEKSTGVVLPRMI